MPRIFRRRWHRLNEQAPADTDSPLNFGTEDRDSAQATTSSDELVNSLFEEARDKAKDSRVGSEVTVAMTENRPDIHIMEIMMSLGRPGLTAQYGMRLTSQSNNTFSFEKVRHLDS